MRNPSPQTRSAGFSFLELQVALAIFGIALAGLIPLTVMQLRQLERIENQFNDRTTYYLIPPTETWERKLGIAATLTTSDSSPPVYPDNAHITFQRPSDPEPGTYGGIKYRADCGRVFGDRGGGYHYGWNVNNTTNTRNRNSSWSPDERYDTLCYMQRYGSHYWEIAVPNGLYDVHIVAGDPSYADSIIVISAEGIPTAVGIPVRNPLDKAKAWVEGNSLVLVTDGRLTVTNTFGSFNNKICYIDITPATPPKIVEIASIEKSLTSEDVTVNVRVTDP